MNREKDSVNCAVTTCDKMVRPKKHLGQHFLRDENIARKIISYINPEFPYILEIGPGLGVLSKYLLQDVLLEPFFMEVDRDSVAYLTEHYPKMAGRLFLADFLEVNLNLFPPAVAGEKFTIIGNFPYNISTQILFRVLDHRNRVPEVIGMFQKEVAERIAAPPGSKTYGIISVLLQTFYSIEYLFTVNETVFYPPPKVKSAVIRLRRNGVDHLNCDETLFTKVVKMAFNQRRKTLRNALKPMLPRELIHHHLSLRAEQLSVQDFIELTNLLSPQNSAETGKIKKS